MIQSVFGVAEAFMANPQYVSIDSSRIQEVAGQIIPKVNLSTESDLHRVIEYELMASSINYCYWYGRHDMRPTGGGATHMYKALDEAWTHYPDGQHTSARFIYFKNKLVLGRYPLLEERLRHLQEVRNSIEFVSIFCDELTNRPHVLDIDTHVMNLCCFMPGFGSDIFLKRASLFFMMVHRRTGAIRDAELRKLPIPADYQVPKMLRWMGILEYSDELNRDVREHHLIPSGSLKECEIRAASILACQSLAEKSGQSMCDVDEYLWSRRKDCDHPFHLTVTTDY